MSVKNEKYEREGQLKLETHISWRKLTNHCTKTDEVRFSKTSWTFHQVLFESLFCFAKLLNIAMMRHFEVMLGQTLNHSV
jgi:hypothetical protein